MSSPVCCLKDWVIRQAGDHAQWLSDQLDLLSAGCPEWQLHIFLGLAPRRLGKADLNLSKIDLDNAERARSGWQPLGWSIDGAARVLGLIAYSSPRPFSETFKDLRRTADAREQIALYHGLPLYREPQSLEFEVGEGLRSNIRPVFEAIAHNNPYPRDHFDEHRWNHMVLKGLFIESRLAPVVGLDERSNPELARILCEYAHERWSADRPVSPELWRCVGPFVTEQSMLSDLNRALLGNPLEHRAAALALSVSPMSEAKELLATTSLVDDIAQGGLTWENFERL